MRITVNGAEHEIPVGTNLIQLLEKLKMAPERVAIEVNLSVIDKGRYNQVPLKEGDQIEIISFVGGGSAGESAGESE